MVDFKKEMDSQKSVNEFCKHIMADSKLSKNFYRGKPLQFDTHKMTNAYVANHPDSNPTTVLRHVVKWYSTYKDPIVKPDLFS